MVALFWKDQASTGSVAYVADENARRHLRGITQYVTSEPPIGKGLPARRPVCVIEGDAAALLSNTPASDKLLQRGRSSGL